MPSPVARLLPLVLAALLGLAPMAAPAESARALLARTHAHGIAVDPLSPGRLLIAAHDGLYGLDLVTLEATRAGPVGLDLMGFALIPGAPGQAVSSGHPATGGNLGVAVSADGGQSWQKISDGVGGPVDFHQLAVSAADPQVIYGIHHGAVLQTSRDGGRTWKAVAQAPERVIALAASGRDPNRLFAATEAGLLVSQDGGAGWQAALAEPGPVSTVLAVPGGGILAFQLGLGLIRAQEGPPGDAALDWQPVGPGPAGDFPLHLAVATDAPERLFAYTRSGALFASGDGGQSWMLIARP